MITASQSSSHRITENIEQWVTQFERDGFLALRGYFSADEIDCAIAATNNALRTHAGEVVVDDLAINERTFLATARDPQNGRFKFNDLYLLLDELRALALAPELSLLLKRLLGGRTPVLCYSLTFEHGSGQPIHIDSLYMTPKTPSHLLATWIALEDVHPDAGPLVYYPGSHKIPLYRFEDGTHHARQEEMDAWTAYITGEMAQRGIASQTFIARKGDLFIWHSDLVHGGSHIGDPTKTRRSLVCHYLTEQDIRRTKNPQLREFNGAYWLDRLQPPVYTAPDRFGPDLPFPEELYLRRHPDVRAAVENGSIPSGFYHYERHGFGEKRPI
ncbi:MAG TPA: phytanoyl-CoA dioxygenase family protein [Chthoniobacterales bacterium]|nr:phytanoyl-CoA dioxygenase family protein [Chthoniobacterales bacterium]